MKEDSIEALGPVARALVSNKRTAFTDETADDFAQAILEIAAVHADDYQVRDADELHLALTRVVMREIPGVDRALIGWLADHATVERIGVVCRMLWHLWSTAVPHPPIDPALVQALIAAAARIRMGPGERAACNDALTLASKQLVDAHTLTLITHAVMGERP